LSLRIYQALFLLIRITYRSPDLYTLTLHAALPISLGYAESASEALSDAELVILATEWQEFRDLDPKAVAELVARTHIIDGRNVLDVASWNAAGWTVEALGRTLTP